MYCRFNCIYYTYQAFCSTVLGRSCEYSWLQSHFGWRFDFFTAFYASRALSSTHPPTSLSLSCALSRVLQCCVWG